MRTAAKAAAFSGYRSTAARRAPAMPQAGPASTVHVATDGESASLIAAISSENAPGHTAMVQWPAWDDWEFTGGHEHEAAAALDPPPRLVFGPAPTLEEATDATADLKEAIEKVYFSSGNVEEAIKVNEVSDIGKSAAILPSMPKHVVQAFSLLHGSQEAQSVVASLACDVNVWDAVMKNDMVLEFCNKHKSVILPPDPIEENLGLERLFSETVGSTDEETSEGSAFFPRIVQTIKVKVYEMVNNISCFLQDFMGASSENHGTASAGTSTSSSADYTNIALGSSFIALAVATILVVLVRRT